MLFGLTDINCGDSTELPDLVRIALAAEEAGFDSLWTIEHLILSDPQHTPSPLPPTTRLFDPIVALSFVAAHTNRIQLATGVAILPFRNPLVFAKQIASLDVLSEGRVMLGVGVGYVRAEFEAMGVPFADRGKRTDDYIAAMQAIWADPPQWHQGRYVRFSHIRSMPVPCQDRIPIVIGGSTGAAYRRAVRLGDEWYGYGLDLDEARTRIFGLRQAHDNVARPTNLGPLRITVTPNRMPDVDLVHRYAELGVSRLNLRMPTRNSWLRDEDFFDAAASLIDLFSA